MNNLPEKKLSRSQVYGIAALVSILFMIAFATIKWFLSIQWVSAALVFGFVYRGLWSFYPYPEMGILFSVFGLLAVAEYANKSGKNGNIVWCPIILSIVVILLATGLNAWIPTISLTDVNSPILVLNITIIDIALGIGTIIFAFKMGLGIQ